MRFSDRKQQASKGQYNSKRKKYKYVEKQQN